MGKIGSKLEDLDYTTTDSEDDPDWKPNECDYSDCDCEECCLLTEYSTSSSGTDDDGEGIEFNFERVIEDKDNDITELKKIIRELSAIIMNCKCVK
tara:strand:+ start:831 stop:1118 length:288 start_codon:yes stop_codon:yes gene_type:complete